MLKDTYTNKLIGVVKISILKIKKFKNYNLKHIKPIRLTNKDCFIFYFLLG